MPQDDLTFDAPGPGTWLLDTQHFPTPMTRFVAGYAPHMIGTTISKTAARSGGFASMTRTTVNGFLYGRRTTVGMEPGVAGAPSVDHPEVKKRIARAFEAYETKFWREERRRWDEEVKPDSIRTNVALASIDTDSLDRDELLTHVSRCRDNAIEMFARHHNLTGIGTIPVGLLMADLAEWTDLPFEDALSLLDGASTLSAGVTPELIALADAIREDPAARAILTSDIAPQEVIDRLADMPGEIGETMQRFLLMDGHRMATGFDVTSKMALELPEIMIANIADVTESGPPDRSAEAAVLARFVRNLVPEEHRESFDEQLADARACFGMKDERGLYNDIWGAGIVRKALLAAGRQLVGEGRISDSEHLMEADWDEIQAVWGGAPEPAAEELADRREKRLSLTFRDAPPFLGPAPSPPAPIEGLPPEVVRWNAASQSLSRQGTQLGPPRPDAKDLTGMTASKGTYEGIARVAVGDYDFHRIKAGDVLVSSTHSEAYNAVAQMVGAIVADTGGPLSHLAIVSREMGIPCIVACKNATALIPDGARVRVDADAGEVTVLG